METTRDDVHAALEFLRGLVANPANLVAVRMRDGDDIVVKDEREVERQFAVPAIYHPSFSRACSLVMVGRPIWVLISARYRSSDSLRWAISDQ